MGSLFCNFKQCWLCGLFAAFTRHQSESELSTVATSNGEPSIMQPQLRIGQSQDSQHIALDPSHESDTAKQFQVQQSDEKISIQKGLKTLEEEEGNDRDSLFTNDEEEEEEDKEDEDEEGGEDKEEEEEEEICPTCLEEYDKENPKIITLCRHHYHLGCILEWAERSPSCPVCNQEMFYEVNPISTFGG